jgi:PIN domain nuclease of toxin-antitoxin system
MPYLFDSHAILAFFQDEQGSREVAGILNHSLKLGIERLLCVVNYFSQIDNTQQPFSQAGDRKAVVCCQFGRNNLPDEAPLWKPQEN